MDWPRRIAAFTLILLSFASVASAGPKEDVSALTSEWGRALGENDPDKVLLMPRMPYFGAHCPRWCGLIEPPCETIS
jgi:hypothetical protein